MVDEKEVNRELNKIKASSLDLIPNSKMMSVLAPVMKRQFEFQNEMFTRSAKLFMDRQQKKINRILDVEDKIYKQQMGVSMKDDLLKDPKYFMAVPVVKKLRDLDPDVCEGFFRDFLSKIGYVMREGGRKRSHDGGIDGLFVKLTDDLRTVRVAIQVKRYSLDDKVGAPMINQFKGSLEKYFVDYGVFITTGLFTKPAIQDAYKGKIPVSLIDLKELIKLFGNNNVVFESVDHYLNTWSNTKLSGELLFYDELKKRGLINLSEHDSKEEAN